jgi:ribulose-5-phosphate 4-epimerase/fuculose-1-phosphate aldolase
MEPGDICILDLEGRQVLGDRKASIEAGMHAAVYAARQDVNAIVHTHQPYASALALAKRAIPALFYEQVRYLGRAIEIVPYAPSGTSFLRRGVAKKVASGANAFILANHGVLVLGGDVEQAVHNMALLEKRALDYLLALLTDGRTERVPPPMPWRAPARLVCDIRACPRAPCLPAPPAPSSPATRSVATRTSRPSANG